MKKIIIEKEEGIADVIDRMLEEEDGDLTFVVPRGSALGKSAKNFRLLKREADAADKRVAVESVDEAILSFAKENDLESAHPLWRGGAGGGVADIIPAAREKVRGGEEEEGEDDAAAVRSSARKGKKKPSSVRLSVPREEDGAEDEEDEANEAEIRIEAELEEDEEKENRFLGAARFFKRSAAAMRGGSRDGAERYEDDDRDDDEGGDEGGRRVSRKFVWGAAMAAVVLIAAFWVVTFSFGRMTATITFKQTPWTYQGNFVADKAVSTINGAQGTIPAQVFTSDKNTTQLFPATGNANVSIKAAGVMTIYNAYSSAKQELVATTRFVTPDGKIFRLVSNIIVPGATVTNGQIVPSSIDAQVAADQAGTAYNIGPVVKLTIPGFQGSPKFDAFYGQLAKGTSGGFVGNKAVPTAADIAAAKTKVTEALTANLTAAIATSYPNNFKIPDGATQIQIVKLTVTTTTDAGGNFGVFGEATLQAIGFDEAAFKQFLLATAQATEASSTFHSLTLNYGSVKADFAKGTLSFSLSANGSLEPAFDAGAFASSIAGKSMGDARAAIASLPQLATGQISAWPMWLWSAPSNPSKITVNAD